MYIRQLKQVKAEILLSIFQYEIVQRKWTCSFFL